MFSCASSEVDSQPSAVRPRWYIIVNDCAQSLQVMMLTYFVNQGPLVLEDLDLGQSMKDIFKGARAATTDVPNELVRSFLFDPIVF